MITEKERRIHRHLCAILGKYQKEIVMVMRRFVVVSYGDLLPPDVLRPVLQSVCEDYTLVLLHNATWQEVSRATECAVVAVTGKRPDDFLF